MNRHFIFLSLLAISTLPAFSAVDYLQEVKPIFAEHCFRCHGGSQQKGGLRVDTGALALKGGDNGVSFKPGKSTESLLTQVIKGTHDDIARMPYKKPPLSAAQIDVVERWINEGAHFPADEQPEKSVHWAFVSPKVEIPPAVKKQDWVRNPIDQFVLARLEKEKIKPSPEADRYTLIRRASLDLTGLLPDLKEVQDFIDDKSTNAYEKVIERLLASPHYGERWGRVWLDVARYADSNGYSIDAPRSIWKYRDWVISSFNSDMPYNQFVVEQLAGDLLPKPSLSQKIATGFNRNTQINQEGGIDPEQFRVESVLDRVNTTATGFLGVTLGCAQCHDHKFDPFTQKEYYQFYAFFNNTVEDGHGKNSPEGMLAIPGELEGGDAAQKELDEATSDLDRYLNTKGQDVVSWIESLSSEQIAKFKPDQQKLLTTTFANMTLQQKRTIYGMFRMDDADFKDRNTRLIRLERKQPRPITTLVMVEQPKPRESFIFIKGDFTRKGDVVTPGVPASIAAAMKLDKKEKVEVSTNALNRLDLAKWITDPANPLTSRVIVNRVWQQYFGRGLVETENDFGTQGSLPSHPEMLDYLATEFVSQGWSLKKLHRLIVTSATYRQSSNVRKDLAVIDPNNRLLARQSRLRLDAEIVRDVALKASGLLNEKIGGPSVFPPQPDGVMNLGQQRREWKPSAGPDRYRRGLYTFFWRATPHPALMVFDGADGISACTRRPRSNTPLQALTLLNDQAFQEFAAKLAARVLAEKISDDSERINYAFRLCLTRPPSLEEQKRLMDLLQEESKDNSSSGAGDSVARPEWLTLARVLLNLDETITRE
ncbi:MAG: cytochrome [Verrucomicrobiales bacterium]|nr:cytochrome [Verrucomicrobiales bacterium]